MLPAGESLKEFFTNGRRNGNSNNLHQKNRNSHTSVHSADSLYGSSTYDENQNYRNHSEDTSSKSRIFHCQPQNPYNQDILHILHYQSLCIFYSICHNSRHYRDKYDLSRRNNHHCFRHHRSQRHDNILSSSRTGHRLRPRSKL